MLPTPSERLEALGLRLPPPPAAAGAYSPVVLHGGLAYVSGQIVTESGTVSHPGAVGKEVDLSTARRLARDATLQALSLIASATGSIDRVTRILRVAVYVSADPGFDRAHEVANGATELLVALYGESGRPARVAMGVAVLPLNAPVEVELTAAIP